MSSFGERLRQEREQRNVALEDIARETKINLRYLDALEREDFRFLPGGAFDKGYVRSYAQFLRIDPEPLLQAFELVRHGEAAADPATTMQNTADAVAERLAAGHYRGNGRGGSRAPLIWIAVAVIVLGGGGWAAVKFIGSDDLAPVPATIAQVTAPAAEEPTADRAVAEPATPARVTTESVAPVEEPPAAAQNVGETPETRAADPSSTDESSAEPETEPQRPAATVAASHGAELAIPEFGVGESVANHRLEGESDRFTAGGAVWFWTRVVGGKPGASIRHVWIYEGLTVQSIELKVGAANWRTQSRKTIWETGQWAVEARDADNRVLARADFTCKPRS